MSVALPLHNLSRIYIKRGATNEWQMKSYWTGKAICRLLSLLCDIGYPNWPIYFFFFFFFTQTGAGLKMIVKYSSTDGSSAIYRSRKGKDRSVHRELIFISVRATTVKRSRVNQRQLSQSKLGRIVATHLPLWCILLNFFYNLKQLFRCNSIFKPVACHNIVSDSLV